VESQASVCFMGGDPCSLARSRESRRRVGRSGAEFPSGEPKENREKKGNGQSSGMSGEEKARAAGRCASKCGIVADGHVANDGRGGQPNQDGGGFVY
jgi:hypothetical protein